MRILGTFLLGAAVACGSALVSTGVFAAPLPALQVVMTGETLDGHVMPPVIALPTGAASTLEIRLAMGLVRHDDADLLLHDTSTGTTRIIDAAAFAAPAETATYYDPVSRSSKRANVVAGAYESGPQIAVEGSGAPDDLANVLLPEGSMVVFFAPEPGTGTLLATGLCVLHSLHRRRAASS